MTVFSAVGVFQIDSGRKRNSGPDLLLSYHENDHYNSVENLNAANDEDEDDGGNGDRAPTTVDSPSADGVAERRNDEPTMRPRRRKDPCPCRSGLRYKDCCYVVKKREAVAERSRTKTRQRFGEDSPPPPSAVDGGRTAEPAPRATGIEGNLRVLRI